MFTGLIEDVGTLEALETGATQGIMTVRSALPMEELSLGESVAVNGVCLTLTGFADGRFHADVSPETLRCTGLGETPRGARLNLERALRLSDRLGGHLVSGHVDGRARLAAKERAGNAWSLRFQAEPSLLSCLVPKGSVAVDGVSLTLNEVGSESFSLMVIPHTLERTNLGERRVGDRVNIETDLLGKYVAKYLRDGVPARSGEVTMDLLAKHGFL